MRRTMIPQTLRPPSPLPLALLWPLVLAALWLWEAGSAVEAAASPAAGLSVAATDPVAAGQGGRGIALRPLPQPASASATPRLRFPTATASRAAGGPGAGTPTAEGGPGSGEAPAPGSAGSATPDGSPAGTTGGGERTRDATVAPGATGPTGGSAAPGAPADRPGSSDGAGSSSAAGPGSGSTEAEAAAAAARGRAAGASSESAFEREPAPRGLLGTPAEDPGIRRLWAAGGSPRAGQSWLARLTVDRPGPWGWGLFYPLLLLAFLWAFHQVWQRLDGHGEPLEPEVDAALEGKGGP